MNKIKELQQSRIKSFVIQTWKQWQPFSVSFTTSHHDHWLPRHIPEHPQQCGTEINIFNILKKKIIILIKGVLNTSYLTNSYIVFTLKMESVSKKTFFDLKMMVISGLEFFVFKFIEPLQRYLLTCNANSAFLGRFFYTGQLQLWYSLFYRRELWASKSAGAYST